MLDEAADVAGEVVEMVFRASAGSLRWRGLSVADVVVPYRAVACFLECEDGRIPHPVIGHQGM